MKAGLEPGFTGVGLVLESVVMAWDLGLCGWTWILGLWGLAQCWGSPEVWVCRSQLHAGAMETVWKPGYQD